MSVEQKFKIEELENTIEDLHRTHRLEMEELEDNIKELKSHLKLKNRVQEVTHAEYTMEYFPATILKLLAMVDPSKRFSKIYLNYLSSINYAIVCGIGALINLYVLNILSNYTSSLWLAGAVAILIAWRWNWTFSVGPLGYLFGLSPRRRKETKV